MAVDEVQDHHPMMLPFRRRVARAARPVFEHSFRWRGLKITLRFERRRFELVIDEVEAATTA